MLTAFIIDKKAFSRDKKVFNLHQSRYHYIPMNNTTVLKQILIHSIVWMIFIFYEVSIVVFMGVRASIIRYAVFYAINICLFYSNFWLLLHSKRTLKSTTITCTAIAGLLLLYLTVSSAADKYLAGSASVKSFEDFSIGQYIRLLWRGMLFIGGSTAFYLSRRAIQNAKRASSLATQVAEQQKNVAQLETAVARAQLNPHLLSNLLMYIYAERQTERVNESDAVLLLAESLHYAMGINKNADGIKLTLEIEHIENIVSIYKLLQSPNFFVSADFQINNCDENSIHPLILVTLVENVFKHGSLSNEQAPAIIKLHCDDGVLRLFTRNIKRKEKHLSSTGLGLKHIDKLLADYYPGVHNY